MRKKRKATDWIDFGEKIVYIYEKLLDNDIDKLVFYFTDQSHISVRKSRKKTIENWLAGRTKKPNAFYLYKFKINEYRLHNEPLFTINSFEKWSIELFKKRIDSYLSEEDKIVDTPNEMRYIYFFNIRGKKLSYFEISYPKAENSSFIHLNSPIYTRDMQYEGNIITYKNMIYISAKNSFDYLHYIFKNNVSVYRRELKVFGVGQCVDALTHEPKAYMALLTSVKLTAKEEREFIHKMNYSNRLIADDFTMKYHQERAFFLENFSQKIYDLSHDINIYTSQDNFSKDMYYDIILEEYKSYISLLEKALYHNDYAIDHRRESILFALEGLCQESRAEVTIAYLLDSENIKLLEGKNSILETQITLVKEEKLKLSYLFIVHDLSLLSEDVIEKIHYIEASGISVRVTNCTYSNYSKILLVKGKDFAIYKWKNEIDYNRVTRNATIIETLTIDIVFLTKKSVELSLFLQQVYTLNGKWYFYSYSCNQNAQNYESLELEINNRKFSAKGQFSYEEGIVCEYKEYTLLLLEDTIIKVHNITMKYDIFRVSVIGDEQMLHSRDVLMFGLLSRKKLLKEEVLPLLEKIPKEESESFRVRVSNECDAGLACFNKKQKLS